MNFVATYRNLSLSKKMMVVLLPLVFIVLVVLIALFYTGAVKALEDTAVGSLTTMTADFHKKAESFIFRTQDIMKFLTFQNATTEALQQGKPENAQKRVEAYKQEADFLDSIGMVDAQGTIVADADKGSVGKSVAGRDFFQAVSGGQEFFFTKPQKSSITGKTSMIFALPIKRDGAFLGAIVARASWDWFVEEFIASEKAGKNGFGFILDENGIVLAHPQKDLIQKEDVNKYDWGKKLLTIQENSWFKYSYEGTSKYAFFFIDPVKKWRFVINMPEEDLLSQANALRNRGVLLLVIALVLFVVTIVWFSKQIAGEVTKIQERVVLAEKGDLTQKVDMDAKDELGTIARHWNLFLDALGGIMKNLQGLSDTLSSASTEMSSTSEQMASTTEEQSSQISTVAAAVEEMTATLSDVAKNAEGEKEYLQEAEKLTAKGTHQIEEMDKAMERILEKIVKLSEVLKSLDDQSRTIGEMATIIGEITDQTNLLALNAAIEAARAGEHGRGFAVVADEVRKLAEKTAQATKEIGTIIRGIQKETQGAVSAMDETRKEVSVGKEISQDSTKVLVEIREGAMKSVELGEQVASSVTELTSTAEDITRNIHAFSQAIEQNASGVAQLAQTAKNLQEQAEEIQNTVGHFKL